MGAAQQLRDLPAQFLVRQADGSRQDDDNAGLAREPQTQLPGTGRASRALNRPTVHHGPRTQQTARYQPGHRRKQALPAGGFGGEEASTPPKSAARLAAEAAFGNPPACAAPQPAVQIVLRRSRTSSLEVQPGANIDHVPLTETAVKRARVFLVVGAHAQPSGQTASTMAPLPKAASKPRADAASKSASPSKPRPSPGRKMQPGPLVQVAPAAQEQPPEAAPDAQRSALLAAALAPVTPLLESVARAQAFTVADTSMASEWLRVALRVAACQAELQAQLR